MGTLIRAERRRFRGDLYLWGMAAVCLAYGLCLAWSLWGVELSPMMRIGGEVVPTPVGLLRKLLASPTLSIWISALLPVLTIAREFSSREVSLVLASGHRRGDYFLIKALELPLLTLPLCVLPPLMGLAAGLGGKVWEPGAGELLRCLALRALLDGGLCAIGLLAAFLLRDVARCTVFSLSHAALMLLLLKVEGTSYGWTLQPAYRLLRFHPALCYRGALEGTISAAELAMIGGGILLAAGIGYCVFRRSELK